jgi:hypothetical protein
MYQNFIIPYLYEAQHVSGDTPPIVRSLKLHWQPLVLHTWKVVGRVLQFSRPPTTCPTTFHVCKSRGCQCNFSPLMMGGVSPETCWASYKYWIIKFWYTVASCWIFLYELYCDARYDPRMWSSNITSNLLHYSDIQQRSLMSYSAEVMIKLYNDEPNDPY